MGCKVDPLESRSVAVYWKKLTTRNVRGQMSERAAVSSVTT